jgi:hypothetical protein
MRDNWGSTCLTQRTPLYTNLSQFHRTPFSILYLPKVHSIVFLTFVSRPSKWLPGWIGLYIPFLLRPIHITSLSYPSTFHCRVTCKNHWLPRCVIYTCQNPHFLHLCFLGPNVFLSSFVSKHLIVVLLPQDVLIYKIIKRNKTGINLSSNIKLTNQPTNQFHGIESFLGS